MTDASDRVFVRMYVSAIKSGLLADMGAERWQTLCALAAYMNEKGECWPSQSTIAKTLGIARQNTNVRIKRLLAYRWRGHPIVTADRIRDPSGSLRTIYRINPESGLIVG